MLSGPRGHTPRSVCCIDISIDDQSVFPRHQLSGLSLLGPMNSTPSIGMSFSLMAFCTQRWYFRKVSVHGSPLRSPFRNFSANQRLKHWSYSRFRSVQASPTLFISDNTTQKQRGDEISRISSTVFLAGSKCQHEHSVTFLEPRDAIGWFESAVECCSVTTTYQR